MKKHTYSSLNRYYGVLSLERCYFFLSLLILSLFAAILFRNISPKKNNARNTANAITVQNSSLLMDDSDEKETCSAFAKQGNANSSKVKTWTGRQKDIAKTK